MSVTGVCVCVCVHSPHRSICWRTGRADEEPLVCSVYLCVPEEQT